MILLNAPSSSPMTSTHMNYMMNPIIMVLDKIFDKFFPGLDKYDFDAAKLNKKIGFWGSKFFIGFLLGIVIGIMGTPHPVAGVQDADKWELVIKGWLSLGLTAGVCFGIVLIDRFLVHRSSRTIVTRLLQTLLLNVFKDVNSTSVWTGHLSLVVLEIWACANVLAPIMLIEAVLLSKSEMVSCHLQGSSLWV